MHLCVCENVRGIRKDTCQDIVAKGSEVLEGVHHRRYKIIITLDLREHLKTQQRSLQQRLQEFSSPLQHNSYTQSLQD